MIGKFHLLFAEKNRCTNILFSKKPIMRFYVHKTVKAQYIAEVYAFNWLNKSITSTNYHLTNTTYWSPEFIGYDSIKNL